ncbi:MAG: bifunctional demethylmenaquinone methyltransferase/2-methoxy-6-polyprenyl-1,4-benzoquinol methylase UbiE [Bacteroidetes bacterium]|nr:bifunctional demethylmenaquinone methyltransferase/2-methoxy-6-polyprenyl-1,4-benzoquinol methylase UbiE [Bacteroidota bacterium]
MKHDKVTPYNSSAPKKEQVATMFDNISGRYDLLNSLLSFGTHKGWRKKCVNLLRDNKPSTILDVATGTADFAIECAKLSPKKIVGIDISEGMMQVGRQKLQKLGLDKLITLEQGNAETITYPDNSFDAIVVGFGVRNFQNLEKGLANLHRILKPGGKIVILEFSYPTNTVVKAGYSFYFSYITPLIGKIFSKDPRAYSYLMESVKAFPNNNNFVAILNGTGFKNSGFKSLSMGVAAIYYGTK